MDACSQSWEKMQEGVRKGRLLDPGVQVHSWVEIVWRN